MAFGKMLLEFRAKHNLTQIKTAEILGVTPYMIFRYENYRSKPSNMNRLRFENKMKEWEEKQSV